MQTEELIIHTDGGSRGNPGPAASGFVVEMGGKEVYKGSKYLGKQTNNVAEYSAVIIALEWLSLSPFTAHCSQITFFLDSELVVKQINGIYKVKDETLKILVAKIIEMLKMYSVKVTFKNVPREQNKEADLLVNQELDNI